jgi:RNA polymerase II elongation factor ELL
VLKNSPPSVFLPHPPPFLSRSGPNRLQCLGSLRERLTIWAAMDSIPTPLSVQEHLTDDARDSESWQQAGDAESQPEMALEEVRLGTARS